jgi:hypothetical protein
MPLMATAGHVHVGNWYQAGFRDGCKAAASHICSASNPGEVAPLFLRSAAMSSSRSADGGVDINSSTAWLMRRLQAYYINLDSRPDRRTRMERVIAKQGLAGVTERFSVSATSISTRLTMM